MNNQSFQKVRNALSVFSAFFILTSLGCGYSLAGRESYLPETISEIGIPVLVNQSTFFDVELILTEKLRAEFIGRGRYRVLPDELGDAILSGEIVSITVNPVGFTDQQLASRYQFALTMSVAYFFVSFILTSSVTAFVCCREGVAMNFVERCSFNTNKRRL